MPDREKVISTFEKIISVCKEDRCDFVDLTFEDAEQILALLKEEKPNGKCVNECECWDSAYERGKKDALKEQEAVALKPHYIDKYGKNFICGVECGNCGVEISATYKFCPYCGRSVKWE